MITINNKEIEVLEGETLIEVARRAGFRVPSMCYAKEAKHKSSCMVCVVRNSVSGQMIPSCSTYPVEGMRIETDSEEVSRLRALSLELLLSDHRADCEAPVYLGLYSRLGCGTYVVFMMMRDVMGKPVRCWRLYSPCLR